MNEINSLKDLLEYSAKRFGNKELYRINNKTISYADFYNYVKILSNALFKKGIHRQKIGIISENRFEWEIAFFAISCSNNIIVPIDKSYTKLEIKNVINKADINTVFTSSNYIDILNEIKDRENTGLKNVFCFDGAKDNSLVSLLGEKTDTEDYYSNINVYEDDMCLISFTSGTTDNPKAVMLSHKNICSNLINVSERIPLSEKDICLSILPLNHVLEGLFCFLLCFYKGTTRIFCNNIDSICDYISKYKITFMGGVPAIYNYLYNKKNEIKIEANHINMFMCGGAPLNSNIVTDFRKIGITIIQGYGLTECAPVVSIENKDNKKIGSVGKPIPNVLVNIINQNEDGIGEIIVKGNNVFLGYLNDEEKSKEVIKDNWLYTGDLGKIDEDGYIFIYGRNKNMIVLPNGKKVFPEEIEELINNIDGVNESLVYENENTKKINAIIVTNDDATYIKEKIDNINQDLPIYKKICDIKITNEYLNRTSSGKLVRNFEKIDEVAYTINNTSDANHLFEKIKEIICSQFGNIEITENTNLRNDLGADSLDCLGLFLNIEKSFNKKITHEQRIKISTVGDILKIIIE